jgi:GNAT superfamily N-acetyltransferase
VIAGDRFLGTGRYVAFDDGGDAAEVAFEVADAEQGHGIGTLLLEQLATVARARGIGRFCAQVEADNRAMLDVFRHCGFAERESCSQGVYDVEMPLTDSDQFRSAVSTRAQIAAAAARARRSA